MHGERERRVRDAAARDEALRDLPQTDIGVRRCISVFELEQIPQPERRRLRELHPVGAPRPTAVVRRVGLATAAVGVSAVLLVVGHGSALRRLARLSI